MGRRVDIEPPPTVLDEREAARQAGQLGRRLALEAVDPPASPQFLDEPGVARRLAAARSEPDAFTRLELLRALCDERHAWGAVVLRRTSS